ncbi:MAG TPA: GAF domain-containing sensor histidine kinase [Anaerolineae bacterium]|nr:GAF domain-containing sensor histidine kinase [Anaerolineae bacterium]
MNDTNLPIKEAPTPADLKVISAAQLHRLLEISRSLSLIHRLDELLAMVMEVSTELTNTETASILLVDASTEQLHFVASTHGVVPKNTVVPLDNSIAGWVVRHGRSIILDDVQSDHRYYANVDEDLSFTTRSMLAVPLITNQGTIGALEVINKRGDESYTSQDVALMEALASQSAVAILNAHLFHQSDLLAELMHEVKTPLMAITAASELLSHPKLPPEKHGDLIGMIQRESNRLAKMTRDFLDFARLESGRAALERLPVDIVQVIEDVVAISRSQAEERGIEIVTDLGPDLPTPESSPALIGDADRLKQALLNLTSNATKYNVENGRIAITCRKINDKTVQISVADTGPGIAPQDLEHLFERFYRIPGSQAEGSGLGLSVAQKLVEEHNGRIEVDSVLGQGTKFTVTLPLTAVSQ